MSEKADITLPPFIFDWIYNYFKYTSSTSGTTTTSEEEKTAEWKKSRRCDAFRSRKATDSKIPAKAVEFLTVKEIQMLMTEIYGASCTADPAMMKEEIIPESWKSLILPKMRNRVSKSVWVDAFLEFFSVPSNIEKSKARMNVIETSNKDLIDALSKTDNSKEKSPSKSTSTSKDSQDRTSASKISASTTSTRPLLVTNANASQKRTTSSSSTATTTTTTSHPQHSQKKQKVSHHVPQHILPSSSSTQRVTTSVSAKPASNNNKKTTPSKDTNNKSTSLTPKVKIKKEKLSYPQNQDTSVPLNPLESTLLQKFRTMSHSSGYIHNLSRKSVLDVIKSTMRKLNINVSSSLNNSHSNAVSSSHVHNVHPAYLHQYNLTYPPAVRNITDQNTYSVLMSQTRQALYIKHQDEQEIRQLDQARMLSEITREEELEKEKATKENSAKNSCSNESPQRLFCSSENEPNQYFPTSVLLTSQNCCQVFINMCSTNNSQTVKDSIIKLLSMEKKGLQWYGTHTPYAYFRHEALNRILKKESTPSLSLNNNNNNNSTGEFLKVIVGEVDRLQNALYCLSEQDMNVPKIFLKAREDAKKKNLPILPSSSSSSSGDNSLTANSSDDVMVVEMPNSVTGGSKETNNSHDPKNNHNNEVIDVSSDEDDDEDDTKNDSIADQSEKLPLSRSPANANSSTLHGNNTNVKENGFHGKNHTKNKSRKRVTPKRPIPPSVEIIEIL